VADRLGYARISTDDQTPDLQLDALEQAGCLKVFVDRATGASDQRPELHRLLDQLRPGDTLVVWRLDRLGRNLKHLIETVTSLEERKVSFQSLTEGIDTSSPGGRLLFHLLGAIAQFERDLISERTRAGLVAARARGRRGGRPTSLTPAKISVAREMYDSKQHTLAEIASTLGVSRATIYRSLNASA
jgi:DNA invertase Pin-like site-specific DNA recombinase